MARRASIRIADLRRAAKLAGETPLFAAEATAARLLDMQVAGFRTLVAEGSLPGPNALGRWDVEELVAIMRGTKPKPNEDFTL